MYLQERGIFSNLIAWSVSAGERSSLKVLVLHLQKTGIFSNLPAKRDLFSNPMKKMGRREVYPISSRIEN